MADSSIGSLPRVGTLGDDSLMVVEQQGQAMHMTGAQFKDFGRQSVIGEVQEYVDKAQAAADSAVGAVKAVTDMTVVAHPSGTATVAKSMKNGVNHLDFGLPQGAQGPKGDPGETGPRGPKGDPGSGLKVLGYYDTPEALAASVPSPEAGDAYGVGTEAPYDIYVFDGASNTWKNNGPFTGGGGVTPENAVTAEGGATLSFTGLGDAPQAVTFTDEEEAPLTAADISMENGESVQEAMEQLFTSVSEGKQAVASAITDQGVETAPDAPFETMAGNIRAIQSGGSTEDATAGAGDILSPKTAYTAAGKVTGTIPSLPARTITPGTSDQTIAAGQYIAGAQVVKGSPDLTPANIRQGVTLFGVEGAMQSSFQALLTVTVDVGAVVTATCGGTEVSDLSTTGTVVLELPIEGSWTVTARRGVTQYNSVVVEVSSRYAASLTAEEHIVYYRQSNIATREYHAAGSVGNYALFGGGLYCPDGATSNWRYLDTVNKVDQDLTVSNADELSVARLGLAAASNSQHLLFAGGGEIYNKNIAIVTKSYDTVDAYDQNMTHTLPNVLSEARCYLAAASAGEKIFFAGGRTEDHLYPLTVDAYDEALSKTTPTVLADFVYDVLAASNGAYAVFASNGDSALVTAYDENGTRITPSRLSQARTRFAAVRAGNYVLIAGGRTNEGSTVYDITDAYDLFLTRTTPTPISVPRSWMGTATLNGFGIIAGGIVNLYQQGAMSDVDIYDQFLTQTVPEQALMSQRFGSAGASIDHFALFGAGSYRGTQENLSRSQLDIYQYT